MNQRAGPHRAQERPIRKTKAPTRKGKGIRVEYVPLGDLERWPRNPKRHDHAGIIESIKRFGFVTPVIVDEKTGRLVAGHGRQEALSMMKKGGDPPPENIRKKGGDWLVPVVRGNRFASEAEAERYLVADNRYVELGGWDNDSLVQILSEQEGQEDLAAMGFDQAEVDRLIKLVAGETETRTVQFEAREKTEHKCPNCGHAVLCE